ncbi:amino acid permease 3-like [Chlorella sorokiniana]|uniref:Amino acid permease 3-like n=1 Tax=Chlorella sorokiniana TaxID=3076 RepID=A0A2P6TTG1_CHLSO|nr:amino acid permease 3-like [Chlorella sorokiniana]|eukprot:PRW57358.1 amino acid permease 3-like [Chlorella sorokiniana]
MAGEGLPAGGEELEKLEKGTSGEVTASSSDGDGAQPAAAPPPPSQRRGQAAPPSLGRTLTRSTSLKKAEAMLPKARQGTVFSATAHIVTAVIGSGVLALPYAVAVMGWVAGPILVLLCAWVTLFTSLLLADCFAVQGKIHRTYSGCVGAVFGRTGFHISAWLQHVSLILYSLAYTIVAAQSLQTVARSVCEQHNTSSCFDAFWQWALVFGGIQLVLGQLPSLHYFAGISTVGAFMSLTYSATSIGVAAGNLGKLPYGSGTVGGLQLGSQVDKAFDILNSLGAILFSFNISLILIEVQDTLRHPANSAHGGLDADVVAEARGPIRKMRKAVYISMALMTVIYMAVACFGYACLGDSTPFNILTGPYGEGWQPAQVPRWVINMANVAVFLRTVPAYQIYSIPFLCLVEEQLEGWHRWPTWLTGLTLRLLWRSAFVAVITFVACLMPFFQVITGLVGAISFAPITAIFPIELWIRSKRPSRRVRLGLRSLSALAVLVTLATTAGSLQRLFTSWSDFQLFGTN